VIGLVLCFLGYHDWRLHAYTMQPFRIIWRCRRCAEEQLTPATRRARAEADRIMGGLRLPDPCGGTRCPLVEKLVHYKGEPR
jgi:hypothetical protein